MFAILSAVAISVSSFGAGIYAAYEIQPYRAGAMFSAPKMNEFKISPIEMDGKNMILLTVVLEDKEATF